MGLYKRGKKWYCCITDANGKIIRKSLSTDKRVAESILAEMRKNIELQKGGILPKDLPRVGYKCLDTLRREFLDACTLKGRSDAYFENFANVWDQLITQQKIQALSCLTLKALQSWAAQKLGEGVKGQSINQQASTIRVFTKWCTDEGHCHIDPLAKWSSLPESDKAYRRDLQLKEIEAILTAEWDAEYRLRWLVYFATGFRASAGTRLAWEWVDWRERIVTLPTKTNKSKRENRLPLHPELYRALLVRHEAAGRPSEGQVFSPADRLRVLRRFRKVCKAAGVDLHGVCLHSVRHTTATMIYNATGGNLKAVQEVLGHRSIATTALYLHVDDEIKRDAIGGLDLSFGQ